MPRTKKVAELKCGHTVDPKTFKPVDTGKGWVLQGYEPSCDRTVRISIKHAAPTLKTMQGWMDKGIAKALDGCKAEPDGNCPHGAPSWLLFMGYI